jgi:hypothetical protein
VKGVNISQEIKNLWIKVSDNKGEDMVTVQEFLEEQESMAIANPKEIVNAVSSLKNESLKLGETQLGLKYYAEAKMMESNVMPLVNESVAAQIEDGMIDLQRKAVTLVGAALKNLVVKRNKQLEEIQQVNTTLSKVAGGLKGIKKLFKKINNEQSKLFDTVDTVSLSSGPKVDREMLEVAAEQWKKDLAMLNSQSSQGAQVKP